MTGRLKSQWKKLLPDAILPDHHHHHQQQQQQQQQEQQQSQQQLEQQQSSSVQDSSSSSGSSSSASTSANSPVTAISSGSDSILSGTGSTLKATKEKLKNIALPSNFRKLRKKFLRYKKEGTDIKEDNTEFEKVAVQQRPARSKKKKQSMLKWKEGAKPIPIEADDSKGKRKPKKKKRQERKKKKLKLSKSLSSELITENEKEQKTMEKEEAETEIEGEEQPFTDSKEEESEFESAFDTIDRKKKEVPSIPAASGNLDTSVGSKTPPGPAQVPSQIPQESTLAYSTVKGSAEFIVPFVNSNQEPVPFATEEATDTRNVSSSSGSQKSDTPSTAPEFDMCDAEPIILSKPACQVLEIIVNKQFFKNAAGSEKENDLIRRYFAGKIPPEHEKDAQRTLEKAVDLAVTRVKSSGINKYLYNFLNNRVMAISLIIDAMKYRKKEFLPEFWNYNRMNKKEPS
ncbi:unnamed protein product [Cercopithifilaria johnstoni]|uniref:Uncharacterized protein n=1 Tax=Cercopithifilaria johnstoni TaxID=2874296 RepID=A0A8J2LND8_9BILA|nr:unnamed protein product [Cercopithifilaria johnstoni]